MARSAGKFIAIEGIDGAGKSTQACMLAEYLKARNAPCMITREPGGTTIGEDIRRIFLDPRNRQMTPECELLLLMSSRAQMVREIVRPMLEKGFIVVSERYIWSSLAYQGHAGDLGFEIVGDIGAFATGGLEPDLTVILDIDPETAAERKQRPPGMTGAQDDRVEAKGIKFQKKVREGFLRIAKSGNARIEVIDGARCRDVVFEDIRNLVGAVIRGPA